MTFLGRVLWWLLARFYVMPVDPDELDDLDRLLASDDPLEA